MYVSTLTGNAGISSTLTINPGMSVSVSGDQSLPLAPTWGLRSDDSCHLPGESSNGIRGHNDMVCQDGGPNDVRGYNYCALGTDATDCQTPPSAAAFVVEADASLSLSFVDLNGATITLRSGGSLSLASMAVQEAILVAVMRAVGGVGNSVRLLDVSVAEYRSDDTCEPYSARFGGGPSQTNNGMCNDNGPNFQPGILTSCVLGTDATDCATPPAPAPLTGAITVREDGSKAVEGSLIWGHPVFSVSSGRSCTRCNAVWSSNAHESSFCLEQDCLEWDNIPPCIVSEGGRCVGRPEGYSQGEQCTIAVSGGGGMLGSCGVFDTYNTWHGHDSVSLPDSCSPNCPQGWASLNVHYGSDCPVGELLNAGESVSWSGDSNYHGRWQICFP